MVEEVIYLERSQILDSKVTSLSSFTTAWPRSWSRPRIRILPSSHFQCVPFHSGSSQYLSNTHTYFPLRSRRQQWIGTFQTLFSMMLLKSGMFFHGNIQLLWNRPERATPMAMAEPRRLVPPVMMHRRSCEIRWGLHAGQGRWLRKQELDETGVKHLEVATIYLWNYTRWIHASDSPEQRVVGRS